MRPIPALEPKPFKNDSLLKMKGFKNEFLRFIDSPIMYVLNYNSFKANDAFTQDFGPNSKKLQSMSSLMQFSDSK